MHQLVVPGGEQAPPSGANATPRTQSAWLIRSAPPARWRDPRDARDRQGRPEANSEPSGANATPVTPVLSNRFHHERSVRRVFQSNGRGADVSRGEHAPRRRDTAQALLLRLDAGLAQRRTPGVDGQRRWEYGIG